MKAIAWSMIPAVLLTLAPISSAESSDHLNRGLNRISVDGVEDTAKLKLLAERGFVTSQQKLAEECMRNHLYADALKWISAVAAHGSLDACFQKGHMLLYGCQGATHDQDVIANPAEGLRFVYMVATNRNLDACLDIAQAFRDGRGITANPVAAYAWFSLCAQAGNHACHKEMNDLALRLSTDDIRKALAQSRMIEAGHWPDLKAMALLVPTGQPTVRVPLNLKFSGVISSSGENLAVINKHTLGENEASQFATESKELVTVTCLQIQSDSVKVQVEGEAQPRILVVQGR
jgi:hypothetical protein